MEDDDIVDLLRLWFHVQTAGWKNAAEFLREYVDGVLTPATASAPIGQ